MKTIEQQSSEKSYNFSNALGIYSQQQIKRERTKARLHQAGCHLLDNTLLSSLTVADICKEANFAHGTFYLYFKDRPAFIADLLLQFVDFLQTLMLNASKGEEQDPVRATTAAYYHLFEENPGLMRCLVNHMEEYPGARNAFQKLNREWAITVVQSTERKLMVTDRKGMTSHDELCRRAYALGGMVDQYLTALLLNKDENLAMLSTDKDAVIDTLTFIWKRGMGE